MRGNGVSVNGKQQEWFLSLAGFLVALETKQAFRWAEAGTRVDVMDSTKSLSNIATTGAALTGG